MYESIHVRITKEQYEWLRQYCFDHRVPQAEVVREALDMFRNQKEVQNMAGGIRCYGCDQDYTEGYWLEIQGEEPKFYCPECAEKANIIGQPGVYEHGPNEVVEVVVLEIDHAEPIERFRLVVPSGDEKSAVKEAIAEVEARGYTVIADDQGGCNEFVRVTDGEDYIAVTAISQFKVRVSADEEYNAEEWWFAARADGNPPACIAEWIQRMGFTPLYLTKEEAEKVRKWAESLPGWDAGPAHAPHPLLFCEY